VLESIFDKRNEREGHDEAVLWSGGELELEFEFFGSSEVLEVDVFLENLDFFLERDVVVVAFGSNESEEVGEGENGLWGFGIVRKGEVIDRVEAIEEEMRMDLRFKEGEFGLYHFVFEFVEALFFGVPLGARLPSGADNEDEEELAGSGVQPSSEEAEGRWSRARRA
jgi:hypothetical protein